MKTSITERKHEQVIDFLNQYLHLKDTKLLSIPELLLSIELHVDGIARYRAKQWILEWQQAHRNRVMFMPTSDVWAIRKRTWEKWYIHYNNVWQSHIRVIRA